MDFGSNLLTWFQGQAQYIVLIGIIALGLYFLFKKEFTKLIVTGIIAFIAVLLVFNPAGVKDLLLSLGNTVLGV